MKTSVTYFDKACCFMIAIPSVLSNYIHPSTPSPAVPAYGAWGVDGTDILNYFWFRTLYVANFRRSTVDRIQWIVANLYPRQWKNEAKRLWESFSLAPVSFVFTKTINFNKRQDVIKGVLLTNLQSSKLNSKQSYVLSPIRLRVRVS